MIILTTILILAGTYILIKGKVNFSAKKELVGPKSTCIGLSFLALAVLSFFIDIYFTIGVFTAIIFVAYFFSQDKMAEEKIGNKNSSVRNLIILGIVALTIGFSFYYYLNSGF